MALQDAANLLDDDEALHEWLRGPHLLHLGRRVSDKGNLHARLQSIMGAPPKGQDEDGAIVKVGPARRILGLAARVEIAQVDRVVGGWPGQAVWRHSAPWRDAVQPAQVDKVSACSAEGHGLAACAASAYLVFLQCRSQAQRLVVCGCVAGDATIAERRCCVVGK